MRRMARSPVHSGLQKRMTIVFLFFLLAFAVLVGRLFMLQIVRHREYEALAEKQHTAVRETAPERGRIFAKDKRGELIPLALNRAAHTLVVAPKHVSNPVEVAAFLKELLGLDEEAILKKLENKDDPYEIVARNLNDEEVRVFENDVPVGIFLEKETQRVYPHGTLGAHAIGFVRKETSREEGRYGLERFYEKDLAATPGFLEGIDDSSGTALLLALGKRIIKPPGEGSRVVVTLDFNIQRETEAALKAVQEKWGAASGAALVLEPKTGRILALAAVPTFDPNAFSKEKDFSVFLNPLVESRYELGSVIKPITMAAGIEEKVVTPESTYRDTGEIRIGSYTIKNFDEKAYGVQTMTQVLEKSLNTGAVHVARLLGQERHFSYLTQFGFGSKTGVDLPGEVSGNVSNLSRGRDIDYMTASFGQGIAVTPLGLASAIGALANGGVLMKPYITEKIIDDSGVEIRYVPKEIRRIVSPETAESLSKMLVGAVRTGFENRAGVKGYFVAGKTGTAQIPRRDGKGYDTDRVIHSFVGYAPAFDPRFLILLQLNEPKGNRFAANTLTPAFHDLAEFILNYYEVPPDEK